MKIYCVSRVVAVVLWIVHGVTSETSDKNCFGKEADIVFLLDSSSSIWPRDFNRQLDFVDNLLGSFQIDGRHIQAGVATFSTNVRLEFHLEQYKDRPSLSNAINSIQYMSGGTETGKAIQFAREEMFKESNGARPHVPHIIVVITDGMSLDEVDTAMQASIARSDGIVMFAIGIGQGAEAKELNRIASKPNNEYVFAVDRYSHLESIRDNLADRACREKIDVPINDAPETTNAPVVTDEVKTYCGGKPADVYFLVDASSSIWDPDFHKQLDFVNDVVDIFDVAPDKTRVGLVAYSDGIHPRIFLDSYFNKAILRTVINNTRHLTGGTNTGGAIKFVREEGFSADRARTDVAHIMVLLTDGQSDNPMVTEEEATKAKEQGIYIFAIGVGGNIDIRELEQISSDPKEDYAFTVDNFDALSSLKNILAMQTCKVDSSTEIQQDQRGCGIAKQSDAMFMYDSNALSRRHANTIKQTIGELAYEMNRISPDIRFSLLTNACPDRAEIRLGEYVDPHHFMSSMASMGVPGIGTMFHTARQHGFSSMHGARKFVQRFAVVFIDDEIDDQSALVQASRLKFKGIRLFIVSIGNNVNDRFAEALSSNPPTDHYIKMDSYTDLATRVMEIIEKICSAL